MLAGPADRASLDSEKGVAVHWHRRAFGTARILLTALAVLAVVGTPAVADAREPGTTGLTITVPGAQPWTATGIVVTAGDRITVAATGTIFIAGSDPGKSPAGDTSIVPCPYSVLAPSQPCWSLIGRIGDGNPFGIGTAASIVADASGPLWFGVNDEEFGDNSGTWTATVIVIPATVATAAHAARAATPATHGTLAGGADAQAILHRMQAAISQANTFRYQSFDLTAGKTLVGIGEVNLQQGSHYVAADGSQVSYLIGTSVYNRDQTGVWAEHGTSRPQDPLSFVLANIGDGTWTERGAGQVYSPSLDVLDGVVPYGVSTRFFTLWIDARSLLPTKSELKVTAPNSPPSDEETDYADFGAPITIQLPPEALTGAPPTPMPTAPTLSDLAAAVASIPPQTLLSQLQSSPFPDSDLPPGLSSFVIQDIPPDPALPGVVGGISAAPKSAESLVLHGQLAIDYDVFSSVDEAHAVFTNTQLAARKAGDTVTSRAFDTYPAALITLSNNGWIQSTCLLQIGNVIVTGAAEPASKDQDEAQAYALALTAAGVIHLARLIGIPVS